MTASRALLNGWPLVAGQLPAATPVAPVVPTLQALLLSSTAATVGQAFSATISGRTAGSTLSLSGAGAAGLSISGTTVSGAPTSAGPVNLVETLAGATNSPRTTSDAATASAAAPAPKFYVIGVFNQPSFNFATWKARGVNTAIGVPDGNDPVAWTTAAGNAGLKMKRVPLGVTYSATPSGNSNFTYTLSDPAAMRADAANPNLLAWALIDEPSDIKDGSGIVGYGHGSFDPDQVDAQAREWRAVAASAGRQVPIWLNQLGNHIRTAPVAAYMRDFADGGLIDWFAADSYPTEEGRTWPSLQFGQYSTDQGIDTERVREWSGGRPQMAFIGTSKQFTNFVQPSADQVAAQIWSSIIHGGFGHAYFPIVITPSFSFDGTPQAVLDRMASVHAFIASIHDNVLMDTVNGGRRPYLLRPSVTASGATPTGLQLPFGLEGAEITAGDGRTYRLLLNMTGAAISVTDSRWGLSALSVPAYGLAYGYTAAEMAASVAPPATATWSTASKSTSIALSNGNRTARTANDNDYFQHVIGSAPVAGKVHVEFTIANLVTAGQDYGIGLASGLLGAETKLSGTAQGFAYCPATGRITASFFEGYANLGVYAPGDVIALEIDVAKKLFWMKRNASGLWNGSATANPATGAGGINYETNAAWAAVHIAAQQRAVNEAVTINTGNAAFAVTPSSGFGGL